MSATAVMTTGGGSRRKVPGAPVRFAAPSPVSDIQRQRILVAMAEVAAERGGGQVTVAHAVARSGVSRRTFYELFADREECLLAALELAVARARAAVLPAYEAAPSRWRERIRAGLAALLAFFDEEPAMARLCVVESLSAGPRVLALRRRVVRALIDAVDEGRGEVRAGRQPPPLTAEGIVGAVLAVIHERLLEQGGGDGRLSPLLPLLMGTIVHPYLGQRASERELARPAPPSARPRPRQDPLEGLDMRLTYRTIRVLVAIGAHPRASNREVASAAEIADQGQISKLLTRLQNLSLIRNEGEGAVRGAPNAWALTVRGEEVERAIRTEG